MYSDNSSTRIRFAGSYFVSLMSIMLVLFVLGMYAIVMLYTDRLLNSVKENIGFEVVIKSNAKESDIKSLQEELNKKDYIKSAVYISKEDATNRMKEDLGEDFLQWLGDVENPLLPSIDVRFVSDYANIDSMAMVEKWIVKKSVVKEVLYQKTLTNTINSNISRIKIVMFAVSLVLLLIAMTLISHTIRLSIYSKRFTVRTMQLVGATELFIMRPFLKTFMFQGLLAAIGASALITAVLYGIQGYLPEMNISQYNESMIFIYGSVVALSLMLTMISTIVSMKKYFNADLDSFYA